MTCRRLWFSWPVVLCSLLGLCQVQPAQGYITTPVPTLGRLAQSTYITLVRVEKVSKENGIIVYRKLHDIKGTYPRAGVKNRRIGRLGVGGRSRGATRRAQGRAG